MRLEHERLDAVIAQRLVAAGVLAEVFDARDLVPDEYEALWAIPCASVSAKRTRTVVMKV
jgi:hypothetical protein